MMKKELPPSQLLTVNYNWKRWILTRTAGNDDDDYNDDDNDDADQINMFSVLSDLVNQCKKIKS